MCVVIAAKPVQRAPIANLPNIAKLEGTPTYHSPKLHPIPCSSVGMGRRTDTNTQTAVVNIHIASATPHAKCNNIKTTCDCE